MTEERHCASDLLIDRYVLGELDPVAIAALQRHASACPRCAGRLDSREAGFAEFARSVDNGLLPLPRRSETGGEGARFDRDVRAAKAPWARVGALALASACAALLLLVVWPERHPPPENTGLRSKGRSTPILRFWVKRGESVWRGQAGERLRPGDALRFGYSWGSGGYLALLNRDDRGSVTVYSPDPQRAWVAPAGRDQLLPESIVLDATPGKDTVHALFCEERVALGPLVEALERSPRALRSIAGCTDLVLELEKSVASGQR